MNGINFCRLRKGKYGNWKKSPGNFLWEKKVPNELIEEVNVFIQWKWDKMMFMKAKKIERKGVAGWMKLCWKLKKKLKIEKLLKKVWMKKETLKSWKNNSNGKKVNGMQKNRKSDRKTGKKNKIAKKSRQNIKQSTT